MYSIMSTFMFFHNEFYGGDKMVGLRSKKKKITKDKILKASKELFFTQGYENTTASQIAEKAEIGVGTVYNYYKSKADIFIANMSQEFEMDEGHEIKYVLDLNQGVADIVKEFLSKYIGKMKLFPRKLVRELISAAVSSFKNNPNFLNKLMDLDYKLMDKLEELLNNLKEKGILDEKLDTKITVEVIYSGLMYEFGVYFYDEEYSFDECKNNINKKVDFVFRC